MFSSTFCKAEKSIWSADCYALGQFFKSHGNRMRSASLHFKISILSLFPSSHWRCSNQFYVPAIALARATNGLLARAFTKCWTCGSCPTTCVHMMTDKTFTEDFLGFAITEVWVSTWCSSASLCPSRNVDQVISYPFVEQLKRLALTLAWPGLQEFGDQSPSPKLSFWKLP